MLLIKVGVFKEYWQFLFYWRRRWKHKSYCRFFISFFHQIFFMSKISFLYYFFLFLLSNIHYFVKYFRLLYNLFVHSFLSNIFCIIFSISLFHQIFPYFGKYFFLFLSFIKSALFVVKHFSLLFFFSVLSN